MATYTDKYRLKKPGAEDFADIADINANMDKIDETLGNKADLDASGKVPTEQLPDLGPDLELGETSETAYRGDRGKTAYDHSQTKSGNPHGTTAKDVGYTDNEELGAENVQDAIDATVRIAKYAQKDASAALEAITKIANTINAVPTQSGSLTYTGSAQSPSWNSYDSAAMTIGGTTTGTNAGTYTATFTPKDGYKWFDGTTEAKSVTWSIGRASLTVPTQSGSLTYTGSAQSPSWNNYDSAKMTRGGTTSGTNAGSYNATFTPGANYRWPDGTTTAKTVTWAIGKAAGSLSISPTSLTITGAVGTTKTIAVTRTGDGAISAVSGNTGVATVSVSGTTVTVTLKGNGSATITVSVAAGTNHTAPANKTCAVTGTTISSTLADNSWATIASVSEAGTWDDVGWNVGDKIDITVSGEKLTFVIMGFSHDDKADGSGKAGITFGMKNLMASGRQMNSYNTNSGGFTGSEMYTWLTGTLLPELPYDLQAVLKSVNKKTYAGGSSSTINTNAMKVFLFSEVEVFGTVTFSRSGEGTQYDYFKTNSKVKYLSNGSGYAALWWERSPGASSTTDFCHVGSNGAASYDYNTASYVRGVCFGFCV